MTEFESEATHSEKNDEQIRFFFVTYVVYLRYC